MEFCLSRTMSGALASTRHISTPPSLKAARPKFIAPTSRQSKRVSSLCHATVVTRLYEWTYQQDSGEALPDVQIELTDCRDAQTFIERLTAAETSRDASAPAMGSLSPDTVNCLVSAMPTASLASAFTCRQAATLLPALARLRATGLPRLWLEALLCGPLAADSAASELSPRQLAEVAWAVSELIEATATGPGSGVGIWAAGLLEGAAPRLPDFFGPDLASLLCACGELRKDPLLWSVDPASAGKSAAAGTTAAAVPKATEAQATVEASWRAAVAAEAGYQLAEFAADFSPLDIAHLLLGLADLGVGPVDTDMKSAIMKAVYSKTCSIEEKAAMDFALSRLEKGMRFMHFDARWTHEELNWLPRIERDKRRLLQEKWDEVGRTQWGGY